MEDGQDIPNGEAHGGPSNLPKYLVLELKSFFTDLATKMEVYETTGKWPEVKAKKAITLKPTLKQPRKATAHNLFIREAIAASKANGSAVPDGEKNYLTWANSKWQKLSKEEKNAFAESKKDQLEEPLTTSQQDIATQLETHTPAPAVQSPAAGTKRKAEDKEEETPAVKKDKKKKKKKKSEAPQA